MPSIVNGQLPQGVYAETGAGKITVTFDRIHNDGAFLPNIPDFDKAEGIGKHEGIHSCSDLIQLSKPIIVDTKLRFTHAKGFALFFNGDTNKDHAINAMMDEGATQWIAGDSEIFVSNHYYRRFSNIFMKMEALGWINKQYTAIFLKHSDLQGFTNYLLNRPATQDEVVQLTLIFEVLKGPNGYTAQAQKAAVDEIAKMRGK